MILTKSFKIHHLQDPSQTINFPKRIKSQNKRQTFQSKENKKIDFYPLKATNKIIMMAYKKEILEDNLDEQAVRPKRDVISN